MTRKPRKILLVHNHHQEPGGEDAVFAAEGAMLRQHGHEVVEHTEDNHRISGMSPASAALGTIWSQSSYQKINELLRQRRPDIVHFHNTFPLISPAAYYAARTHRVQVVQTLHNYRLLCPNALFLRDGIICEDCMGKLIPWPGIIHACYRHSRSQTMVTTAMLAAHRLVGSWTQMVDAPTSRSPSSPAGSSFKAAFWPSVSASSPPSCCRTPAPASIEEATRCSSGDCPQKRESRR
jgi:Glycosyltransferase Family 4